MHFSVLFEVSNLLSYCRPSLRVIRICSCLGNLLPSMCNCLFAFLYWRRVFPVHPRDLKLCFRFGFERDDFSLGRDACLTFVFRYRVRRWSQGSNLPCAFARAHLQFEHCRACGAFFFLRPPTIRRRNPGSRTSSLPRRRRRRGRFGVAKQTLASRRLNFLRILQ